ACAITTHRTWHGRSSSLRSRTMALAMADHRPCDHEPSLLPWPTIALAITTHRTGHDGPRSGCSREGCDASLAPAMFDPGAPSSVLAIAELNKPGTMHEIHGIALLRSGHEEDAKDLATVSIARVLNPDDLPWHLGGHTFLVHMFSVVRQTWY